MTDHRCPVDRCPRLVESSKLLCHEHWRLVPRYLQNRLYRAYDHGRGAGSLLHNAAVLACVEIVNRQFSEGEG